MPILITTLFCFFAVQARLIDGRQQAFFLDKPFGTGHVKEVAGIISELRNRKITLSQVAAVLNERKLFSTTGRRWTSESLRKFMKRYMELDPVKANDLIEK